MQATATTARKNRNCITSVKFRQFVPSAGIFPEWLTRGSASPLSACTHTTMVPKTGTAVYLRFLAISCHSGAHSELRLYVYRWKPCNQDRWRSGPVCASVCVAGLHGVHRNVRVQVPSCYSGIVRRGHGFLNIKAWCIHSIYVVAHNKARITGG